MSSHCYGQVFMSTYDAFNEFQTPSVYVPDAHPFSVFWHSHLSILTKPGNVFDSVIDALIAIGLGDPSWDQKLTPNDIFLQQSKMRGLLTQTPPNITILTGFDHYGYHLRDASTWNFIGISNKYVNLWMDALEGSEQKLALTALIITSIHHEMGHWVQTIKAGRFSPNSSFRFSASNGISGNDDPDCPSCSSSPSNLDPTFKFLNAAWEPEEGEAGNYVEVQTRGGIMEYDDFTKTARLVVGPNMTGDWRLLESSYLKVYMQDKGPKNSLLFHSPASESTSSQHHMETKAYFPFHDIDNCQSRSSSMVPFQRYHGYTPSRVRRY